MHGTVPLEPMILLLVAITPLWSQGAAEPAATPISETGFTEWRFTPSVDSTWVGGDLEDSSSDLDMLLTETALRLDGPLWPGARVTFSLSHEHRRYDFDGPQPFVPAIGDPWRDVHSVGAGITILQGLSKRWGALLGFTGRASASVDAELGDGLSGAILAGVGYDFGGGFRAGAGALLLARFEEDLTVVPAIQLRWDIDEQWRLSLEGPRLELRWKPSKEWAFTFGGAFDGIRFRLPDDPARDHGIVEDRRLSAFLQASWRPEPWIEIEVHAGADLWRQIRIEDRRGDTGQTFDFDPAPFVGAGVTLRF